MEFHSQGSESNNSWCSVAVPSFLLISEVPEAAGGAYSQTLSGGGPHSPLQSAMSVMGFSGHL